MFDEDNQNGIAPKNLPTEPEDMFAGVGNRGQADAAGDLPDALSNGLLKKKDRVITPPTRGMGDDMQMTGYKTSSPILGKILLIIFILIVVGGIAYGVWWFFSGRAKTQTSVQNTPVTQEPVVSPATTTSSSLPNEINNDSILFGQGVDLDKDGLDDVREKEIGTNPQNPDSDGDNLNDGAEVIVHKSQPLNSDSDGDGLSDGDEYLIWKTDITNPDSDNDTYPDGTEVKNGYSPLGPGKLFSAPVSSTASSTVTSTN
jgi:hypothetical protein